MCFWLHLKHSSCTTHCLSEQKMFWTKVVENKFQFLTSIFSVMVFNIVKQKGATCQDYVMHTLHNLFTFTWLEFNIQKLSLHHTHAIQWILETKSRMCGAFREWHLPTVQFFVPSRLHNWSQIMKLYSTPQYAFISCYLHVQNMTTHCQD
jgi:hypothetical protein